MATILEIVTEWEGTNAERVVDDLQAEGVSLGNRGLWTAQETDAGIRLHLVEC
jgi:hypothetical protein